MRERCDATAIQDTTLGEATIQLLTLPPKKGDSWKVEVSLVNGTSTVDVRDVDVPAGKFKDAVVVTTKLTGTRSPVESTWWFAKGVGLVKQVTKSESQNIITELVKFVPGK